MLYDIGYGNRGYKNIERVMEILSIDILVDVRMRPYCRYNTSLNTNSLKELLGDRYLWVREFGGDKKIGSDENKDTLKQLFNWSEREDKNILLMCCEADYRRCHRSEIVGYLKNIGLKGYKHLNITDFDSQTK
jgi:uncharacterized protein (DUF488 family)